MDRAEFKIWADDISRRLPDVGKWISGLSKETRDLWFEDIFASEALEDALTMSKDIMDSGEALGRWERDKLPRAFLRGILAAKGRRLEDERRRERQETAPAYQIIRGCPVMSETHAELLRRQDEYRKEHNVQFTPDDVRRAWLDEIWR